MKKKWEKPKAVGQVFEPNEYCSACWYVGCDTIAANAVELIMPPTNPNHDGANNYVDGQTHSPDQCGVSGNQVIYVNNQNIAESMFEINSKTGVRQLRCNLFTDNTYSDPKSYSTVNVGDTIFGLQNLKMEQRGIIKEKFSGLIKPLESFLIIILKILYLEAKKHFAFLPLFE